MIHLGLIGYPLGHSLSPRIHSAALRACGLAGDYSLFPIQPDDKKGLEDLLTRVCSREITGLNVTIPHKQNIIPLLDILTETAEAIGAVNTIYLRNHRLIGDNTDAPGFLADLRKFLAEFPSPVRAGQSRSVEEGVGVKKKQALVLGAGGSARAIVYALLKDGWIVILAARRIEQAQQLAYSFGNYELSITDNNLSNIDLSHIALIVNATPVGMSLNTDRSPWPENLSFPRHAAIYDLVYNPRETKLMIDAQAQGLSAITGLGMLMEQAALAFELWTGKQVSREILFPAVEGS